MAANGLAYAALGREDAPPPKIVNAHVSKGYGPDPDLHNPIVPWPKTMSANELHMTAVLADFILPGTEQVPAPSALSIQHFMDEWVSAPYPQQQADRTIVLEGLRWIDTQAQQRWQHIFVDLEGSKQKQILDSMIPKDIKAAVTAQERFFLRFRSLAVGAYYTTSEGFREIGYVGNVALPSYPPISENERSVLDAELSMLWIA